MKTENGILSSVSSALPVSAAVSNDILAEKNGAEARIIATKLREILSQLDSISASIAAAHLNAAVEALGKQFNSETNNSVSE